MGYVSKAGWTFVWGEAQSLVYICVLLFTNLIEQHFSPFQHGVTASFLPLTHPCNPSHSLDRRSRAPLPAARPSTHAAAGSV
jgi:hypothetical protein